MSLNSNAFARNWAKGKFSDPKMVEDFLSGSMHKDNYLEMIADWLKSKKETSNKAPDYSHAAWAYEVADKLGQAKALDETMTFIKHLTGNKDK